MANKRIVSVELPQNLYEKLKELSKDDDRSLSAYIRRILDNHIKNSNWFSYIMLN